MRTPSSESRLAALFAGVVLLACQGPPRELDPLANPRSYREVPPAERIRVPCYYAIEDSTDRIVVQDQGYGVRLGRALAGQLQAALGGLCRGTGRVKNRAEFLLLTEPDPAVLFQISAVGQMDVSIWTWATNTGELRGRAVAYGPGAAPPRTYEFAATGEKRQYYAEEGSGAEGFRRALGDAVQNLVDQARADRSALEALGRPGSERAP